MACKTYCVYKHVLPNNKIYIGITKQNPLFFGEEQENK